MAAVFGIFSGILDRAHQLCQEAWIRTGSTRIDVQFFRIKLLHPRCETMYGRVSARIRGAEGAIERVVFPAYEDLWNSRNVPELPGSFSEGHVQGDKLDLCDCLPEYEACEDDWPAEALDIVPPVSSVGFMVDVCLVIDELEPGTVIRGVVALSDDDRSARGRRRKQSLNASPTKDSADLVDVTVTRDDTAGVDKS
jgi:hypothetical protein